MNRHLLIAAAMAVATLSVGRIALAQSYAITQDTYIDSYNPTYNAGSYNKVKAVDDPASSADPGSTSTTRVLFYLPTSFWTAVDNAIASGTPILGATVNYYPVNNSLGGYSGGHVNGPDPRNVELHPMTTSWTVGDADYAPNSDPTDPGATWDTSNGTTPWTNTTEFPTTTFTAGGGETTSYTTNVGGDYDINNYVLEENANPSGYFTWDITPLLNNPTALAELQSDGAMLKVNDDTTYDTTNDIQYFVSLDSSDATSDTPYVTLTLAPEPATLTLSLLVLGGLGLGRRRCV